MGIQDLQNIITAYQTKIASLQSAVTQKTQTLDTAQSNYDIAVAQGNIDNISNLSEAVTTAKNDLEATNEALQKYSSVLPLERSQIITVWESVYDDTIAPIATAKTALDTAKQSYMQAINNYINVGDTAEATRRQFISLFSYADKLNPAMIGTKGYLIGEAEHLIKNVPGYKSDVKYNYEKIKL